MRHQNSLSLFTYWDALRAGRPAPSRSDIEPSDIRRLLPHVFICEVSGEAGLTFRLAGTSVCALKGRELKGEAFADLWFRDGQRNAARTGTAVVTHATPANLALDILSEGGRVAQAEMLMLPVTGPSGRHDRLIGVLSVIKPPYWIGHDPVAGFSTTGIRFFDTAGEPMFLANRPEVAIAAPPAANLPGGSRRTGHLVVLEGGRRD